MSNSNRIKELTQSLGISSKELSRQTGIPYDSLKNYEYGRREPSGTALVALENFFGVSGAYILGQSDITDNIFSWDDEDIMATVKDSFSPLIKKILIATKQHSEFEVKMLFDIFVELRHIAEMSDVQKRTELFSLVQSVVSKSNQLIGASNKNQDKLQSNNNPFLEVEKS